MSTVEIIFYVALLVVSVIVRYSVGLSNGIKIGIKQAVGFLEDATKILIKLGDMTDED